ncbi:hypothetical protein WJX74_010009 [Apatococcus lobatus]|uniref:Uncharacterized protein n=1 Tax=Apatococcus lobatus TaxID=904363 RepID=A0AAW1PV64_9CHLO
MDAAAALGSASYDLCGSYPAASLQDCSPDFLSKVVGAVFKYAEATGLEISETLADLQVRLLLAPSASSEPDPGWSLRTYCYGPQDPGVCLRTEPFSSIISNVASLEESPGILRPPGQANCNLISLHTANNMLEGSTGCHLWQASFLLAEYVLSHPDDFRGKICAELGCGTGLVGICLSHLKACRQIILTDGNRDSLENCCRNLDQNGVPYIGPEDGAGMESPQDQEAKQVILRHQDWADCWHGAVPDVILGADLLYDPGATRLLVILLEGMLRVASGPQPMALLAATARTPETFDVFTRAIAASALQFKDITRDPSSMSTGLRIKFQHLVLLQPQLPVRLLLVSRR